MPVAARTSRKERTQPRQIGWALQKGIEVAVKKIEPIEAEAVELPLLEAGGPDERLFVMCACGHSAAFHDNLGCQRVTPAKIKSGGYSGSTSESTPETACTCPTPREVVYICGRKPAEVSA